MKSTMMRKRALQEPTCECCNTPGCVCEKHNTRIQELDLPKKANPSREYDKDKTYQDKGTETELNICIESAVDPARAILSYIKNKRIFLEQLLQTRGEAAVATRAAKELAQTVPGVANINTSILGGVIAKYLIQLTQKAQGQKVMPAFNDNQFLQEIQPILERKQPSMKSSAKNLNNKSEEELEDIKKKTDETEKTRKTKMPKTKEGSYQDYGSNDRFSEAWHEFIISKMPYYSSLGEQELEAVLSDEFDSFAQSHPGAASIKDKAVKEFLQSWFGEEAEAHVAAAVDLGDKCSFCEESADHTKLVDGEETPVCAACGNKTASLKTAAEGGADEEETEEETTAETAIVSLLDACKNEWTNLGEPVNPGTWPKEVERAILELNESITKAIESIQGKLIEGEFYSKNVDEGVSSGGGSDIMNDLEMAPMEEGSELMNDEIENNEVSNEIPVEKKSSKTASADITSTETKKALKFVEDLQDKVANIFFDYKKSVEMANNSSLIKSAGEDMVRLKSKLSEVEKVLSKQLNVLSDAEEALDKKSKKSSLKTAEESSPKVVVPTTVDEVMRLARNTRWCLYKKQYAEQFLKDNVKFVVGPDGKALAATSDSMKVYDTNDTETHAYDELLGKTPKTSAKKEVPEFIKKKQEEAEAKKEVGKKSSAFIGLSLASEE